MDAISAPMRVTRVSVNIDSQHGARGVAKLKRKLEINNRPFQKLCLKAIGPWENFIW